MSNKTTHKTCMQLHNDKVTVTEAMNQSYFIYTVQEFGGQ